MEKELNISAILKDKPVGTKLWSPIFGNCVFSRLSGSGIRVFPIHNGFTAREEKSFFVTGQYTLAGEVYLFPSKQMPNWSKFAWKKGDVLVSNDSDRHIIFKGFSKDDYTTFKGKHWICVSIKRYISHLDAQNTQDYHIEDDKAAAQTYINTVEERLGGKLNLETLKNEKQPKPEFKDGDVVVYGKSVAICRKICKHTLFPYVSIDETSRLLFNDNPNVSPDECRFATEEEKQQLFAALDKEGKRWNAENKQIEDLPKKCELKPFDKVLVKIAGYTWTADFFSHYDENDEELPYICIGYGRVTHCIPYNEETKHLLGTADEWKGGE